MKLLSIIFLSIIALNVSAQDTIVVAPPPQVILVDDGEYERYAADIEAEIFDFPEVETQFKGGSKGMQTYISKHVKYPMEAIENNIQGKVYLRFIVEKSGEVSNVHVERGVHASLDREARRVIANMPKWKPGKNDGKKVRTRVRLPINFTLN